MTETVKLVTVEHLGKAFFRLLSKWQPDDICRTCGQSTTSEVITEKRLTSKAGIAMPCDENQACYDGVIKQIESIAATDKQG